MTNTIESTVEEKTGKVNDFYFRRNRPKFATYLTKKKKNCSTTQDPFLFTDANLQLF